MLLMVILMSLNACSTSTSVSSFCLIYKPVYSSDDDTFDTRVQIAKNNAVWEKLCEK